ncbi:hypothetical protein TIFTF001_000726 [Ficus carica]|uniref:Alpha-carbonic anhydrase domain-containing protein n=1 Tax=Ficus carica TaxID=3494 RepID=A0AA87YYE5_FICCA|nr:hypothetical protein TIFTF001_000726 [Ficus carica]
MEKLVIINQILFCSFFIFLVLHFCPVSSQEVEDERAFDYEAWSTRGPARWGRIRPEWHMCNNGTMQSPIDLLDQRVQIISTLQRLRRFYKPANATLLNRGHDMMIKWTSGEAGYIDINGTQYLLQQCHWHSPSEHTVNGRRLDLELHMVHQSRTGQIVVIGIAYRIGIRPDLFLTSMETHLQDIANMSYASQPQKVVGLVDPRRLSIRSPRYYRYIGSLTVPPCIQNVVWIVLQQMRPVAREQVRLLRMAVRDSGDVVALWRRLAKEEEALLVCTPVHDGGWAKGGDGSASYLKVSLVGSVQPTVAVVAKWSASASLGEALAWASPVLPRLRSVWIDRSAGESSGAGEIEEVAVALAPKRSRGRGGRRGGHVGCRVHGAGATSDGER